MKTDKYQKLPLFHFSSELKRRHIKKNLKCVIFGNFGAMNLGDEAILAGEIQELQKLPNIAITVVARYPEEIKRLHQVQSISLYNLREIRRAVKKSDFVIVGGGGLINKVERSFIGFGYQLYMLFTFFFLPRFYKRKLYIFGVGIYSNANSLILHLAYPLIKYASIVTVRDHHSYAFLKSKNIHAMLYKDNSFLMDLAPMDVVMKEEIFKKEYRKDRDNIGISLVKPDSPAEEKRLINEISAFILDNHKYSDFWFYPADYNPEYEGDHKLMERVLIKAKKQTKDPIILHTVPMKATPQVFFGSIKLMNRFIAMRFHAAVFAYRNKVRFTGISYDKKVASFLEAVGKTSLSLKTFKAKDIENSIL
ncbi:MAG: polysaccharide pyruvyl transferase family protein [Candidatus Levyibacteriota bacterium]